jgi:isopentenyl diphosphate isomerase/L-lactate dehydrogenase-like FMN-dependent dehydrogenase
MPVDFVTNQEIILAARRNLSQNVWDYLTGGVESETTMRRNRFGLDSLAFRPRVLVDVSKIDPSTTFLGHRLKIPVMLAPIGSLQAITPQGGVAVSKATEEFGTINFVSSVTQPSLEEIAAAAAILRSFNFTSGLGAGGSGSARLNARSRITGERNHHQHGTSRRHPDR